MKTSDFGSKLPPEIRYFQYDFSITHVNIAILKIKSQLLNLRSNFETYENVGDNIVLHVQVYIHLI